MLCTFPFFLVLLILKFVRSLNTSTSQTSQYWMQIQVVLKQMFSADFYSFCNFFSCLNYGNVLPVDGRCATSQWSPQGESDGDKLQDSSVWQTGPLMGWQITQKIHHRALFLEKSGSHLCLFPDKNRSSTLHDSLQTAARVPQRAHSGRWGQESLFTTDAISPATFGPLKADVETINLETFCRQLPAWQGSGMCGQK